MQRVLSLDGVSTQLRGMLSNGGCSLYARVIGVMDAIPIIPLDLGVSDLTFTQKRGRLFRTFVRLFTLPNCYIFFQIYRRVALTNVLGYAYNKGIKKEGKMTRYNLTPSESQKNPCEMCKRPAQFAIVKRSGYVLFGCKRCFR